MGLSFFRGAVIGLLIATSCAPVRADDILFIGNSFTYGEMAPVVKKNGGVPKLLEAIASAKGKQVMTTAGPYWSRQSELPLRCRKRPIRKSGWMRWMIITRRRRGITLRRW